MEWRDLRWKIREARWKILENKKNAALMFVAMALFLSSVYMIFFRESILVFTAGWAKWSGDAVAVAQTISNEKGISYTIVDYDQNKNDADRYGVSNVPSFVVIRGLNWKIVEGVDINEVRKALE